MNINTSFPNKAILEIIFLNRDDFYNICFQNNNYLIVGRDQGIADNVIAIATNGKVYYITLHNNDVCYIAESIDIFVNELLLFDRFIQTNTNELKDDQDESQLIILANSFRNELLKLNQSAFQYGTVSTFWSEVCEEIEYGILI